MNNKKVRKTQVLQTFLFSGADIHNTSSYFGDTYSYMHSLKTSPLLIKNICIDKRMFDD